MHFFWWSLFSRRCVPYTSCRNQLNLTSTISLSAVLHHQNLRSPSFMHLLRQIANISFHLIFICSTPPSTTSASVAASMRPSACCKPSSTSRATPMKCEWCSCCSLLHSVFKCHAQQSNQGVDESSLACIHTKWWNCFDSKSDKCSHLFDTQLPRRLEAR